ncbi:MAG: heterodisulfide reductase [Epsilonproteobacteria bacterium]|nr:heterodisulfide reductase [Campylobacterota bacterium]
MKSYFLFESLIEREKTAPMLLAARQLIEYLNIDAIPFTEAKADVGSEFIGLDKLKFLEHYAYNLTRASNEKRDILCVEQSSFISHAYTKELLLNDEALYAHVAKQLAIKHITLNLESNVVCLEQVLIEEVSIDALKQHIKHPFSHFQTALFLGSNACRAQKYRKETLLSQLLTTLKLKSVSHASMYESDGYEVLRTASLLAKQLASRAMLDMFDNAADFVLISDARSFVMFDFYQQELEKIAGREINLPILSLPQLLLLAFGMHDKKSIGLAQHKVPITLI